MNKRIFCLSALLASFVVAGAWSRQDSTDVFFRHLKLNEVTVTGLTGESRLREIPAPVSVVTERELQATSSTNIIDALAKEPGVSQITTGGGISKPVIRGLGYNRVAVVNDGIRQEGQQWGDEHGVELDGESIGSVEILKGPYSLMYGSDAMAGVLIFHPKSTVPVGTARAGISTEYQTNNGLFNYSIYSGGNKQGLVWDARWSQKLAHAYKNRFDGYVPGSQFQEQAARLLLGINRVWGHSHLILSYYHLLPGIIEGERDALTGQLEAATEDLKTYGHPLPFQHVYHYKAVWDNSVSLGNGRLKTLLGYQQNQRKEYEESTDEYGLYFQLHTLNYDARYELPLYGGWKLAVGANGMYQRSLNKGEEYLIPAYRLFDVGSFVTATCDLGRLHLTGGLRLDRRQLHSERLFNEEEACWHFVDFSRHFTGLSASVGAVCNLTDDVNLRVNLSRGFRAPNMSELGSFGEHEGTGRFEVGNNSLKPEHSWQADLGLDYNSRYVSAQVALFANRIDHYIFLQKQNVVPAPGTEPRYRYQAGDARLMGFEASVDVHPVHSLHIGNSFSLVDAVQLHQQKDSKYLPMTPAPCWQAEVKYELTHDGRPFNNTYVAVGTTCFLRQSHFLRANDTETATPSYTLVNFSAGTDLKDRRGRTVASFHLMADNLLDRGYQNHLSRLKYMDLNRLTLRRGIYNMGRNIVVKLQLPFSFSL